MNSEKISLPEPVAFVNPVGDIVRLGSGQLEPGTKLYTAAQLAAAVEADRKELEEWRELGKRLHLGLPTWPNSWSQDVSIAGFAADRNGREALSAVELNAGEDEKLRRSSGCDAETVAADLERLGKEEGWICASVGAQMLRALASSEPTTGG